MIYTIYKSVNKQTGQVYIGFDSKWPNRQIVHKSASKKGNSKFYNAIRKYGWESFHWEVVYQSKDREHTLKIMEPFFIEQFDSFNKGYNLTLGGDGTFGHYVPESARQKISDTHRGKTLSQNHIKILIEKGKSLTGKNNPMYGKTLTEEHKRKISESTKGISKPITDEHKKNLRCHSNNSTKVSCPHCGKSGQLTNMKRWHFDKCKLIP